MYVDTPFTRDNLNEYLKALAKEFRRLNGTKIKAEIVLVGGAAILANYGFRELTYDVDAVIVASSAMKESINIVSEKFNLPGKWLNSDFKRTKSYSDKLLEVSTYYKTFSNILQIRTISAEYLVAMKLMSGRLYKHDISDIYGILWEHQRSGAMLEKATIELAVKKLYGSLSKLPETSTKLLEKAFETVDYEDLYKQSKEDEKVAKEMLIEFEGQQPNVLKSKNIDSVLEEMRQQRNATLARNKSTD